MVQYKLIVHWKRSLIYHENVTLIVNACLTEQGFLECQWRYENEFRRWKLTAKLNVLPGEAEMASRSPRVFVFRKICQFNTSLMVEMPLVHNKIARIQCFQYD